MNFSVTQPDLKRALAHIKPAVAPKSTLPVLAHVQITVDDGRLRLAATNLALGMIAWIKATVDAPCAICMPAELLSDVVGALPDNQIKFAFDDRTQRMDMTCTTQHQVTIKGIEADEFPKLPDFDVPPTVVVASDMLARALDAVTYAVASDDTRPALAGVHMRVERDRIVFSAADGFRAARFIITLDEPLEIEQPIEFLPQGDALAKLAVILRGQESVPVSIRLAASGGFITFDANDVAGVARLVLIARLIEGRYPEVDRIIPSSYNTRIVIERALLAKAVKLASYFASSAAYIIRLEFLPDSQEAGLLRITANAAEIGDNKGEVDAFVHGDKGRVALNVVFLAQMLEALKSTQMAIESQGEQYATVFRPVAAQSENELHVLMPMTVR